MKLTACSGVAASRSQTTPSAMVRLERCDGCTTETRLAYSEGCHALLGWVAPLLPRARAVPGRPAALLRGSSEARWGGGRALPVGRGGGRAARGEPAPE